MYVKLLAGLAVFYLNGFFLLALLRYDPKDLLKRPHLAFFFGTGITAFLTFLLSFAGIPLKAVNGVIGLAMLLLPGACALVLRKGKRGWTIHDGSPPSPGGHVNKRLKFFCLLCILIIAIQLFCVLLSSSIMPEASWDGRARWAFKAKIFYQEERLDLGYFSDPKYVESHPYYPLLVPLNMAHLYSFMGEANDSAVKLLFALYVCMAVWTFFDFLRRSLPLFPALIFTAFLGTIPGLYLTLGGGDGFLVTEGSAYTSMADLPLAFHAMTAVIFLLCYLRNRNSLLLAAGAILLSYCAFTKLEGFYFSVIVMLSLAAATLVMDGKPSLRAVLQLLMLAGVFLALYLPWALFKWRYVPFAHENFPPHLTISYALERLDRLTFILPRLLWECVYVPRWHVIGILFLLGVLYLVVKRKLPGESICLLLAILGYFGFLALVYMLSTWWGAADDEAAGKLIEFTINRLYLTLAPIVLIFSALSLRPALGGGAGRVV